MRDWIAVIVAVLGVLLVLAGAVLIVLQSLPRSGEPAAEEPPAAGRLLAAVKNPTPADRLIFWGIVLLVLAAVAAGAISFELGARGGS